MEALRVLGGLVLAGYRVGLNGCDFVEQLAVDVGRPALDLLRESARLVSDRPAFGRDGPSDGLIRVAVLLRACVLEGHHG
ncbi:hypothetical protein, partial [Streptomyces sp. NPDC005568]|uniref:hypothetical protein n=1 Tax=Streptomyces sp. NPDC005568 TaxID=3156887 RepID=UPI0033A3CD95